MNSVKIGPFTYNVVYTDKIEVTERGETRELLGQILYNELLIQVSNECNKEMKLVTLLHEVIHGILFNAGLSDTEQTSMETVIDAIAIGLYGLSKDNPEFLQLNPVNPDSTIRTQPFKFPIQ